MVPRNINVHNRAKGARRYVILSPCPSAVMKDSTLQINCPAQVPILASITYSAWEGFLYHFTGVEGARAHNLYSPCLVFPGDDCHTDTSGGTIWKW